MDLNEKYKLLQAEAIALSARRKELTDQIAIIDRRFLTVCNKKRAVEQELVNIQLIPTGRSGKPAKKRKEKPLDVSGLSSQAAEALLAQLKQSLKGGK